jgi:hypothetical protein
MLILFLLLLNHHHMIRIFLNAICYSDVQVLVENILRLTYFYRELCEWYDLYVMICV